ncbi:hypothetical protein BGX38DRAFT_223161 [Terfezia claveryi]|nr:hypothetical protein BGX38DRAFT_223161 [Terfezia claveryi]
MSGNAGMGNGKDNVSAKSISYRLPSPGIDGYKSDISIDDNYHPSPGNASSPGYASAPMRTPVGPFLAA